MMLSVVTPVNIYFVFVLHHRRVKKVHNNDDSMGRGEQRNRRGQLLRLAFHYLLVHSLAHDLAVCCFDSAVDRPRPLATN